LHLSVYSRAQGAPRPAARAVRRALARAAPPPLPFRLRPGGRRALARGGGSRVPRAARAVEAGRARARSGGAFRADQDFPPRRRKDCLVERPLRLIPSSPVEELA